MDDHLTPPPAPDTAPPTAEAILAPIERRVDAMTQFSKLADLCGHPDRPGNEAGYCVECWAVFKEEHGIDTARDELVVWDQMQQVLADVIEHPEKRKRILTRRMKAVRTRMILNLPIYARLHLKAAAKAAEDGDARPAEWALANLTTDNERTVDVAKPGTSGPNGGVKVFIGVKVGGLPPSTTAIDVTKDDEA
jgi:hypothetical protein